MSLWSSLCWFSMCSEAADGGVESEESLPRMFCLLMCSSLSSLKPAAQPWFLLTAQTQDRRGASQLTPL